MFDDIEVHRGNGTGRWYWINNEDARELRGFLLGIESEDPAATAKFEKLAKAFDDLEGD
jgi:hypothetical protein